MHVADITATHGLKGALLIHSHTRPAQAVAGYLRFWVGVDEQAAKNKPLMTVSRCWQHGRRMLLQLDSVNDIEKAALFVRHQLWIKRDDVDVGDDEYLWNDLIGMTVFDDIQQKVLGVVQDVQDFGAQDTLLVQSKDGDWMIPFIEEIVTVIDDDCIHVSLPEGMDACFTPKS
ncbi:MAG: ribosome maturation factor RimM [Mariprofundaceae bacterium]|nr:ribosome maturation factor RimM [Mariprofundaceae bacterium]